MAPAEQGCANRMAGWRRRLPAITEMPGFQRDGATIRRCDEPLSRLNRAKGKAYAAVPQRS
jgi:hypothetical protein